MLLWLLKAEVCMMMNCIDYSKVTYRTVSAVCPPFCPKEWWIPFHLIFLHLSVINGTASLSIKSQVLRKHLYLALKKKTYQILVN